MKRRGYVSAFESAALGLVFGCGLIGEAHAAAKVVETGEDQPISLAAPPGFIAPTALFRSDLEGFFEGESDVEVADILTVRFQREVEQQITGESGTIFQVGFKKGSKIDEVPVYDPGLFGGVSDRVALYVDTTTNTLAVGFTSDGAVPEPSTWAMMLISFAGIGLAGYRISRKASRASIRSNVPSRG